ncbi:MAG: tetratricopeptide repeat protein [Candidatus Aminicenantes bacterium]|nr:tetratricopeptide repeat protein [Candidatus Aminicenantes bacterium]
MKAILPATLILLTIACGGVKPAKIDFHLPALPSGEFSDANFRQGWEQLQKGDSDAAYRSFQLSEARLDRKQAAFGYVFLARQKYSAASDQFAQALATNPENLEAGMGLAMIHEFEGKTTDAFQAYADLLTKAPDDAWLKLKYESIKTRSTQEYLQQAESYQNTDKGKYIDCLQQAHFFSPEMTAITLKIATFFYEENQWQRSRPFYEAALEKEPYNQDVLLRLAAIYEKDGKFDLALVTLDRLLAFNPGDAVLEAEKKRIRDQFQEMNLPEKFKKIFFKTEINREEMAALIGYYFDRYIEMDRTPEIITDIDGSFAKEQIIKSCTAGIMGARPDHSFDRFSIPDRATFAVTLRALVDYLVKKGQRLHFTPLPAAVESLDLSPLHMNYETIKFMVNAQILPLDSDQLFNPTRPVSPNDVIFSLKKILNSISE